MNTHFNLSAAEYEAHREGAVEERRRRLLRQSLDDSLPRLKHVIEIGCGPGRLLAELAEDYPGLQFTGIDISPAMIAHAQQRHRRPNLRYEVSDISDREDSSGAEFAFSVDVLHHIHALDRFFQAARRLIEPGGEWLAIEPNIYHPYIYYSQERMRRAGFDEDHFRPWVAEPLWRRAGFEIASRGYASVFPGCIRRLARPLARLESRVENCRFLGGSVVYRLVAARPPTKYQKILKLAV
jgi:SAM-dependent methyltransferase